MLEADVQDWLDRMADSFFNDDFEAYAASVAIPFDVTTPKGRYSLRTRAALRTHFENWRDMLLNMQATHMVRTCRSLDSRSPDNIECQYDTQLLSDAVRIAPVFRSVMKLERSGSDWRAVSVVSEVNTDAWPVTIPQVTAAH